MTRSRNYLRIGDDDLDQARAYRTRAAAIDAFAEVARELDRFGQEIEASIHLAPCRDQINEYPDFVLSLGPRGGVRVERT